MYDKVLETAEFIKSKVTTSPKVAVILGSGLGDLVDRIEDKEYIKYEDIPNFPVSTVEGHAGQFVFGKMNGVEVVAMQGRFHFYEGYAMKDVAYPVYVMKQLGIEKLIVSNAAGGANKNYEPGTLMIINDFINLLGTNPLVGKNDSRFGERFPDMSEPFSFELIDLAKKVADEENIDYKEGVYAAALGPYYETKAEVKYISMLGADAIGMSTVPETIVANYLGLDVLGISVITNMCTGIQKEKHSHERVVETARIAGNNFCNWIEKIVNNL